MNEYFYKYILRVVSKATGKYDIIKNGIGIMALDIDNANRKFTEAVNPKDGDILTIVDIKRIA